jgi:hypothetical protein
MGWAGRGTNGYVIVVRRCPGVSRKNGALSGNDGAELGGSAAERGAPINAVWRLIRRVMSRI